MRRQEFSILLTGRFVAGDPTPSGETTEVHPVERTLLDDLTMDRTMKRRINHFVERPSTPYFD